MLTLDNCDIKLHLPFSLCLIAKTWIFTIDTKGPVSAH